MTFLKLLNFWLSSKENIFTSLWSAQQCRSSIVINNRYHMMIMIIHKFSFFLLLPWFTRSSSIMQYFLNFQTIQWATYFKYCFCWWLFDIWENYFFKLTVVWVLLEVSEFGEWARKIAKIYTRENKNSNLSKIIQYHLFSPLLPLQGNLMKKFPIFSNLCDFVEFARKSSKYDRTCMNCC